MPSAINGNVEPGKRIMVKPETMAYVRERAAKSAALKAIAGAEVLDGIKINVIDSLGRDVSYLLLVLEEVKKAVRDTPFLFAIFRGAPHKENSTWPLVIAASSTDLLRGAVLLTQAKFLNRVHSHSTFDEDSWVWTVEIKDLGRSQRDVDLLWEVVRKTPYAVDPQLAPAGSRTLAQLTSAAHSRLSRLTADQAHTETKDSQSDSSLPAVHLVDIRPAAQRTEHGTIPGAVHVERIMLESCFDVKCAVDSPLKKTDRFDSRIILFDQEGTASALAAAALNDMGLLNATDMIGGFDAWKGAGLPIIDTNDPNLWPLLFWPLL